MLFYKVTLAWFGAEVSETVTGTLAGRWGRLNV
jgi:hypothetical protein